MTFNEFCESLETKIQSSYLEGVTLEVAEKLAAEFLHAQLKVSSELAKIDLDSRMRKSGVKAVKAAIYMESATKSEKKPTEAMLSAMVDSHAVVQSEQEALDRAEVLKAELDRVYNVFQNAHIYYRGIAKGNFNG